MPIEAKDEGRIAADESYTPPPSMARSASDWATSFIRGLAKETVATAGTPGDIREMLSSGTDVVAEKLGIPAEPIKKAASIAASASPLAAVADLPSTADIRKTIGEKVPSAEKFLEGKPETTGGEYAESVGGFVPTMAFGEGGLARRGLAALTGGVGSEALGKLGSKVSDTVEPYTRVLGGVLGQGLPGLVKRAITPLPISAERKALVDALRKQGVEPSAGDVSGSKVVKYAEHALGDAPFAGGANAAVREKIKDDFGRAALSKVGENAPRATPEVMDRAYTRIGKEFDDLAARNTGNLDNQYIREVMDHRAEYEHLFDDPLKKPIVVKIADMATKGFPQSTTIDGEQYQALSSRLRRMQRSYRSDPELSDFFGDMHKSLDDMMERSIAKNNPNDLGKWKDARRQYRNMLVIEKAVSGAADEAGPGVINPNKLRAAAQSQSRRGYVRGQGDFASLASAGDVLLKPPPSSGTSERAFLHAIPAALGAGVGQAFGGAPEALLGAVGMSAAPGLAGRALMSPLVQSYLKNQALRQHLSPGVLEAMVRSAIANKAAGQGNE